MAKKEEVVVKKTTKVTLEVKPYGSSIVIRENGLPWVSDRTEKAVEWLKAQGYKPAEIELVGQKPANWDAVFEIAPPVSETPVVTPEVEVPIAPIADPADPTAFIDKIVETTPTAEQIAS